LLRVDDVGTLAPGARGDITVIDPDQQWEVDPAKFLSKSRNTPFGGTALRGMAIMTIVGGEVVFDVGRSRSKS
jgi:dihydroorotase